MPTCSNCKKRKIKCDGQTPACAPCTNRRHSSSPCDYNVVKLPHSSPEFLPRGDACIPCRRKKKKCNAERPACRTCVVAKKEDGCVYNTSSTSNATALEEELERLLSAACWPTTSPTVSQLQWPDPVPLLNDLYWTGQPVASPPESVWSASASTVTQESSPAALDKVTSGTSDEVAPVCSEPDPGGSLPLIPVSESPQSHNPLPDHVNLQLVFIKDGIVLGQSATRKKWQAVYAGDTSWSAVHPALIHVIQLFGARIVNRSHKVVTPIDEGLHLTNALMAINTMPPLTSIDAVTHIQSYCLLAVHFMKSSDLAIGREWLLKADVTVRQFDMHITLPAETSTYSQDAEVTQSQGNGECPYRLLIAESEEDEKRDTLCQLLYIDNVTSLRMQLPTLLSPQLRLEFEDLLVCPAIGLDIIKYLTYTQAHYLTRMREASIVFIRMASIALLQEARTVLMDSLSDTSTPPHPSNFSVPPAFATTIRRIHIYLADLNELLLTLPFGQEDWSKYLMLQQCTIVSETALASIYHLLSPRYPQLQSKCIDAIADIVNISDRLSADDCAQLDPILSVCWSITLNMAMQIQQRIAEGSLNNPGVYSGMQMGQMPMFIDVLRGCSKKVKWPFPLSGGMTLGMY